jgi:hypothetical protein
MTKFSMFGFDVSQPGNTFGTEEEVLFSISTLNSTPEPRQGCNHESLKIFLFENNFFNRYSRQEIEPSNSDPGIPISPNFSKYRLRYKFQNCSSSSMLTLYPA